MNFNTSRHWIFILSAVVLSMALSSPVQAQERVKSLTQKNIKAFIEETTDITANNSKGLSADKIKAYLDKHLEDKARFKSLMRYNIPNMPPQEAELSMDKDGFMKSVSEGAGSVDSYETLVEIKNIKIASNGKKAFVKTSSTEYADMNVPTSDGGTESVPVEGVSECTQILSLNKGVIQMYSANCVTNIEFLEH